MATAPQTASVPSPIGGLNAQDSLAAMPQNDALVLNNWWPQPYGCTVRKGYKLQSSNLGGVVETLFTYAGRSGALTTFAWAGANFFNIAAGGAMGAPDITGLTNAQWSAVNLVNSAGSFMIAVNGADDGIMYDGTNLSRITLGGAVTWAEWTGLDPKDAIQLTIHQHRLWAVQKDSTLGWFSAIDAIQGALTSFDFGPLFSQGGYLSFLTTWTIDDGNGAEDHLVAVSSQGEAVVFGGTDPESDTAWQLVGVYFVGAPVAGRRSYTKAGGDLLFLTQQGVVSMATLLVSTRVNEAQNPLTAKKIQFLLSDVISRFGSIDGWDIAYYPKYNMLLINVPSTNYPATTQLAANQITGAWTLFSNMPASCWGFYDQGPLFGDYNGNVWLAWEGDTDGADAAGENGQGIVTQVQQAYSYIGSPGIQKQVTMYRPVLLTGSPVTVNSRIQYDFENGNVNVPTSAPPPGSADRWDSGIWDQATWSGASTIQKQWIQAEGVGIAASLKMIMFTDTDVLWVATDYAFKQGASVF